RRLILQTSVSIDGYVAALDGSHPWGEGSEDEAFKHWILDSVWAAVAHLMGRVTYEEMAAVWPTSTSEYARPMNEIPKVVFSRTLQHGDWPETRSAAGRGTRAVCCRPSAQTCAFAFGARTGVRITLIPSPWKVASKVRLKFASRSWIR